MAGERLLTRSEVVERIRLSKTVLYRMMQEGEFPRPLKMGGHAVRWIESEVSEWVASRPRSTGRAA